MDTVYWVGSREDDVKDDTFFQGSITRYGNDNSYNVSFCNTNESSYIDFVKNSIEMIHKSYPSSRFYFANGLTAYKMGNKILNYAICIPPYSAVESLNDKVFMRNYLHGIVDTLPYIVINKSCLQDHQFVSSIFGHKYNEYMVQSPSSAGGFDSMIYSQENCIETFSSECRSKYVIVSPFIDNAITVNAHIIVSKTQYRVYPPSIQLTSDSIHYCGSDFGAYNRLSKKQKDLIMQCINSIAKKLIDLGCLGIIGIDLLVKDNYVYFLECNYRYQGSSCTLNIALRKCKQESLFQDNYNAFYDDIDYIPVNIYEFKCDYSCFRRTEANTSIIMADPYLIYGKNPNPEASLDGYLEYDIYNHSIIDSIQQ